jgi:uncharacterized protein
MSDQISKRLMSTELLEKFTREYLALPLRAYVFDWHGGESSLAGLPFFKRAIQLQEKFRKKGQIIRNTIQTNATCINNEWAAFFKAYSFGVGVSLDGNRESHNHFRKNVSNNGTFDQVVRGIEILRRHGIEPGIIQVLTQENLPRIPQNFRFFLDNLKIKSWGINPYCEEVDPNNKEMTGQGITPKDFTKALKTYIELWLNEDDPNLQIREIDDHLAAILGRQTLSSCTFHGLCHTTFCLEWDGRIYPCDRLSGRKEFLLGDLTEQPLSVIINGERWLKYAQEVNNLPSECRICKRQAICMNGCPYLRVGGLKGRYYYCQTRKDVFAHLEKVVIQHQETKEVNHEGQEGDRRST